MSDVHNKEQRSRNMAAIKSKNTKPEICVRKLLWALGYRYRLHRRDLPGRPDIVFPGKHKLIFVNGCFWHQHRCKYGKAKPKSNAEFWEKKRNRNSWRD